MSLKRFAARRGLVAVFAACTAFAAVPAIANADIGITSFNAGPEAAFNNPSGLPFSSFPNDTQDTNCSYANPNPVHSTQAGAVTDYCLSFTVNTGDAITGEDILNSTVANPVGTSGAYDVQTKCTAAQFAEAASTVNTCPGASQVGTSASHIQIATGAATRVNADAPGRIYALDTPTNGAAAEFGVAQLVGPNPALGITVPTESKYTITFTQNGQANIGLLSTTSDLPNNTGGAPIAVQASAIRFWGSAAAHPHRAAADEFNPAAAATTTMAADFNSIGTSCTTPQTSTLTINPNTSANPYNPGAATSKPTTATSTLNLTGCDGMAFTPSFTASTSGDTTPSGHPQLNIGIKVPAGNSSLGATQITLPLGLSTDLKNVQNPCSADAFAAANCPAADVIGSVTATITQIAAQQVGTVYQVRIPGQSLPGIGLSFGGRYPLRVLGVTSINSQGRIVNTFTNLPDLQETALNITINGGNAGILQTSPGTCSPSAFDAVLTGQNAKQSNQSIKTSCGLQYITDVATSSPSKPRIVFNGIAPTGKSFDSVRVTLPSGLTINSKAFNKGKGIKVTKLSTKKTAHVTRLSSHTYKIVLPKGGSTKFESLNKSGVFTASKKFAKSTSPIVLTVRTVYTDGGKVDSSIGINR